MLPFEGHSVKHEIAKAFMSLMTKKTYLDITVTDIVNEAGVARASFYRNFNSIGDIIDLIVDDLFEDLVSDVFPIMNSGDERKIRGLLFEQFYRFSHRKQTVTEIGMRNLSVLFSRMDQKMKQYEDAIDESDMRQKYLPGAKMTLINGIIKKWIDTGMKETPEEMIDFIMSFIMF